MNLWSDALRILTEFLVSRRPNVVGVGWGNKIRAGVMTDQEALMVLVRQKLPLAQLLPGERVPGSIGNRPTDVVEVGEITPHYVVNPRLRHRPLLPGLSIDVETDYGTGTAGCFVFPAGNNDEIYYLTNWHVTGSQAGVAAYQPGAVDDPRAHLDAPIGRVLRARAPYQRCGRVDAGLIRLDSERIFDSAIPFIGPVIGTAMAYPGLRLRKFGRTTGYTEADTLAIKVSTWVNYGDMLGRQKMRGQILAGRMSAPGDSGSLLVDGRRQAIGLLFAGSDTTTLGNPIKAVLDAMKVRLI